MGRPSSLRSPAPFRLAPTAPARDTDAPPTQYQVVFHALATYLTLVRNFLVKGLAATMTSSTVLVIAYLWGLLARALPAAACMAVDLAILSVLSYILLLTNRARSLRNVRAAEAALVSGLRKRFGGKLLVTQHRRSKQRRAETRRKRHLDLFTRLKALTELDLPESDRDALATDSNCCNLWEGHSRMSMKGYTWCADYMCNMVQRESNNRVRNGALVLLFDFYDRNRRRIRSKALLSEEFAVYLLDVLDEPALNFKALEAALGLLSPITGYAGVYFEPCALIWMRLIAQHRERSKHSNKAMDSAGFCVMRGLRNHSSDKTAFLLSSPHSIPYLCEAIATGERCRGTLLARIFEQSTSAQRRATVAQYEQELRQILPLISMSALGGLVRHAEFANIVVSETALMHDVYARCKDANHVYYEADAPCRVIWHCLDAVVNDDAALTEMLGSGYLSIAAHFARDHYDRTATRANLFRAILVLHPEFKRYFKAITSDGPDDNETARLGRSIRIRAPKAAWYVVEPRDDDY